MAMASGMGRTRIMWDMGLQVGETGGVLTNTAGGWFRLTRCSICSRRTGPSAGRRLGRRHPDPWVELEVVNEGFQIVAGGRGGPNGLSRRSTRSHPPSMRRGPSICANHADRLGDQYLLRVTRSIRGHRTQADALHLNQFGRGQTRGCDHYLQPVRWVLCMVAGRAPPEFPGCSS